MESNKLRRSFHEKQNTLLLPISLGVSSVVLLHTLDWQLQRQQERSGRPSYHLHVVFVERPGQKEDEKIHNALRNLLAKYSNHKFSVIALEDVFDYDAPTPHDLADSSILPQEESLMTNSERLGATLTSLPSANSRNDFINNLRSRLLVAFAKVQKCDSIVYGDSTTRIAERTLSETAKGRGGSLPWLTSDGLSLQGIKISYPLRDLLRKELVEYAHLASPPLTPFIIQPDNAVGDPLSSANTTIDDLMGRYFKSVEQTYPSVVANVVRTSGRLLASKASSNQLCVICRLPVQETIEGLYGTGEQSNPNDAAGSTNGAIAVSRTICYGCARSNMVSYLEHLTLGLSNTNTTK